MGRRWPAGCLWGGDSDGQHGAISSGCADRANGYAIQYPDTGEGFRRGCGADDDAQAASGQRAGDDFDSYNCSYATTGERSTRSHAVIWHKRNLARTIAAVRCVNELTTDGERRTHSHALADDRCSHPHTTANRRAQACTTADYYCYSESNDASTNTADNGYTCANCSPVA